MSGEFERLKNKISSIQERLNKVSLDKLCIWGAGNSGISFLNCIKRKGLSIITYVDSDSSKWGKKIGDYDIISPDKIRNDFVVLICALNTSAMNSIKSECKQRNLVYFTVDEYIFGRYSQDLFQACQYISDEESLQVYCNVINSKLDGRYPSCYCDNQYFAIDQFKIRCEGAFIDMGAYDGSELDYFFSNIYSGSAVVCFEPDPSNYSKLKENVGLYSKKYRIDEKKVQLVCAGIGRATKKLLFNSGLGTSSSVVNYDSCENEKSNNIVQVYSVDDYINNNLSNTLISFLKADIEGFELDMLNGAKETVLRFGPKLAICLYHTPADFFDIICFIKQLNSDYHIAIRHHSKDWYETVMYAYL